MNSYLLFLSFVNLHIFEKINTNSEKIMGKSNKAQFNLCHFYDKRSSQLNFIVISLSFVKGLVVATTTEVTRMGFVIILVMCPDRVSLNIMPTTRSKQFLIGSWLATTESPLEHGYTLCCSIANKELVRLLWITVNYYFSVYDLIHCLHYSYIIRVARLKFGDALKYKND